MQHSADCPPDVYAALSDGTTPYAFGGILSIADAAPRTLAATTPRQPVSVPAGARLFARRDVAERLSREP